MTADDSPSRLHALQSRVRIGKFVSVGVLGAVVDTSMLMVLTHVFGVVPEIATAVGIETAILFMFVINDRWTFAGQGQGGRGPLLRRVLRSHAVRAGGSVTQFVIFVIVYRFLFVAVEAAGVDLWLLAAKGCGIAVGMIVNYVFESLFTWRVHVNPPE